MPASVVDLPEPVGPVTRTSPRGRWARAAIASGTPRLSSGLMSCGMRRNAAPTRVALLVDVDAEAGPARQGVGEVELEDVLEDLPLLARHDRVQRLLEGVRLHDRELVELQELAGAADGRVRPGGEVQVGAAELEHVQQQVGEERAVGAGVLGARCGHVPPSAGGTGRAGRAPARRDGRRCGAAPLRRRCEARAPRPAPGPGPAARGDPYGREPGVPGRPRTSSCRRRTAPVLCGQQASTGAAGALEPAGGRLRRRAARIASSGARTGPSCSSTCAAAWCSSMAAPLTTTPLAGRAPAASARGRRRRRAAPGRRRTCRRERVRRARRQGADEQVAAAQHRRVDTPRARGRTPEPGGGGQRLDRLGAHHEHRRAGAELARARPAPSGRSRRRRARPAGGRRSRPASRRAATMPWTSVLCARPAPVAQHDGVGRGDVAGEVAHLVEQRQDRLLERHRQRQPGPGAVEAVEQRRAGRPSPQSTASYVQSSPSAA